GVAASAPGVAGCDGGAVASRVGLAGGHIGLPGQPGYGAPQEPEARAIAATCGGVQVWSLYVPNGREVGHDHYAYKLRWLEALRDAGTGRLAADPDAQIAYVGDFNVAPEDHDVWDMAAFEGATHVTEPERAAFTALTEAGF